jgi:elongator complex protein 1
MQHDGVGEIGHAARPPLQLSGAATRAVEAGAELIAAPPGTSLAVMQMPRGNLEGVHVRALTLASVTENLLAQQYGDAMEEAASQRVDLNVLVDFQWPKFIENVDEFVKQVKADSICDLLSALRPENCLSEGQIYASDLAKPAEGEVTGDGSKPAQGPATLDSEAGATNKVNLVCQALQKACVQVGGTQLRAALMSFVRCVIVNRIT